MKMYYMQWDVSDLNSWRGFETDTTEIQDIEKSDYLPEKEKEEDDLQESYTLSMESLGFSYSDFM
jgi:hypothetical protein